jgi:phosphonate transport system substrate-binding protein
MSVKRLFTTIAMVLLLSSVAFAETTLSFTAIPDENSSRLKERFSGVATYLSNRLGMPVEYVPVKSYAASVTAFKNNTVHLAWFGGLSGVQARQAVPESQAIAQGLEDPNFKSYLIAHVSTGLEQSDSFPKGIEGKTFTFGSQGSTSGRLMPEYFIRKELGKSPDDLFKRVGFSGDHSKTISLVEAGSYEVGAVNYAVWDKGVADGSIDTSKVKVIWTTPGYPDYNWSIRGDVDKQFGEGFARKVQDALTALDDQKLLASFPRKKFIVASNELYEPIVETGQQLGILRK